MKTITINAYRYDELSDKAKENAVHHYIEGLVGDWWHENALEDAKEFCLDIQEFDVYRSYCNAKFIYDADETAKAIVENAGGELLELAKDYQKEVSELFKGYSDYDKYQEWLRERDYTLDDLEFEDWVIEETDYQDDKESAGDEFLSELEEYYLSSLKADYEYFHSEEYIQDFYESNDYLFDINGKVLDYEN
jgi:hypothetical protein